MLHTDTRIHTRTLGLVCTNTLHVSYAECMQGLVVVGLMLWRGKFAFGCGGEGMKV